MNGLLWNIPLFNSLVGLYDSDIENNLSKAFKLKASKNWSEIFYEYIENMTRSGESRKRRKYINDLRVKIKTLLKYYPDGIQLEKFSTAFQQHFLDFLNPKQYNFENVVDLLKSDKLSSVVSLKFKNGDVMIYNADSSNEANSNRSLESSLHCLKKQIPKDVVQVFKQVITSYGGSLSVDGLVPEYEYRSGKKLNLQDLGVSSIIELISLLEEDFKICSVNDSQFYIFNKEESLQMPTKLVIKVKEEKPSEEIVSKVEQGREEKCFAKTVIKRIQHLLMEEFPQGLSLEELEAAYRGFYGAHSDDLDPSKYGRKTLESILLQETEIVRLLREQGKIIAVADSIFQAGTTEFKLGVDPPHRPTRIVNFSASFDTLDPSLIGEGDFVDVVVADVYSPSKFWIIKRARDHSQALDDLMDRMLAFYGSEIGSRFMIPKNEVVLTFGAPVAALYAEDLNFYRAIIISMEDVQTVKCFFIDYGTNASVPLSSLRFLHEHFFKLPAQALKCALYGIEPTDGRSSWPKSVTSEFLIMVRDKAFAGYVNKNQEEGKLMLTLFDTSQDDDIDINGYLVSQGMARYKDGISPLSINNFENSLSSVSPSSNEDRFVVEAENTKGKLTEEFSITTSSANKTKMGKNETDQKIRFYDRSPKHYFDVSMVTDQDLLVEENTTSTPSSSVSPTLLPDVLHQIKEFDSRVKRKESESVDKRNELQDMPVRPHKPPYPQQDKQDLLDFSSMLSSPENGANVDFSISLMQSSLDNERVGNKNSCNWDLGFNCSTSGFLQEKQDPKFEELEIDDPEFEKWKRTFIKYDVGGDFISGGCLDTQEESHQSEVFYSDPEDETNSSSKASGDRGLIAISLSSGTVVHLVVIDSCPFIPQRSFPSLVDDVTAAKLERALRHAEDGQVLVLSRGSYPDVCKMLSREERPFFFFPVNESTPTGVYIVALSFFLDFIGKQEFSSIPETCFEFLALALEQFPYSSISDPVKRGGGLGSTLESSETICSQEEPIAKSTTVPALTPDGGSRNGQESRLGLHKVKWLPADLCQMYDDVNVAASELLLDNCPEKREHHPSKITSSSPVSDQPHRSEAEVFPVTSISPSSEYLGSVGPQNCGNKLQKFQTPYSKLTNSSQSDNSSGNVREEILVSLMDQFGETDSPATFHTPFSTPPNDETKEESRIDDLKFLSHLRVYLKVLTAKQLLMKEFSNKDKLNLKQEIEYHKNLVDQLEMEERLNSTSTRFCNEDRSKSRPAVNLSNAPDWLNLNEDRNNSRLAVNLSNAPDWLNLKEDRNNCRPAVNPSNPPDWVNLNEDRSNSRLAVNPSNAPDWLNLNENRNNSSPAVNPSKFPDWVNLNEDRNNNRPAVNLSNFPDWLNSSEDRNNSRLAVNPSEVPDWVNLNEDRSNRRPAVNLSKTPDWVNLSGDRSDNGQSLNLPKAEKCLFDDYGINEKRKEEIIVAKSTLLDFEQEGAMALPMTTLSTSFGQSGEATALFSSPVIDKKAHLCHPDVLSSPGNAFGVNCYPYSTTRLFYPRFYPQIYPQTMHSTPHRFTNFNNNILGHFSNYSLRNNLFPYPGYYYPQYNFNPITRFCDPYVNSGFRSNIIPNKNQFLH